MAFSSDRSLPPVHFSPGAGQVGTEAGMRAMKPPRSQPKSNSQIGGGQSHNPGHRAGGSIGLPKSQIKPQEEGQPTDLRHLMAIAQHTNMKGLGRNSPFGVWFINNGLHRQLFQPGQWPYDILDQG
jgi:hypothetical protein